MATVLIKQGKHFHKVPPLTTLPWMGRPFMEREVMFDEDCAYHSPAYNGQDVNKLFGLSFGLHLRKQDDGTWDLGTHWNSARFGWRWSHGDQCLELLAYCYHEGRRNWDEQLRFPVVAQVAVNQTVTCCLYHTNRHYVFRVDDEQGHALGLVTVPGPATVPRYGLTLGTYFGGALPAPHDMHITLNRT